MNRPYGCYGVPTPFTRVTQASQRPMRSIRCSGDGDRLGSNGRVDRSSGKRDSEPFKVTCARDLLDAKLIDGSMTVIMQCPRAMMALNWPGRFRRRRHSRTQGAESIPVQFGYQHCQGDMEIVRHGGGSERLAWKRGPTPSPASGRPLGCNGSRIKRSTAEHGEHSEETARVGRSEAEQDAGPRNIAAARRTGPIFDTS